MKLSEILTEAKNGGFLFKIAVKDASKIIANASGELSFASSIFQRKGVVNLQELESVIKNHSEHEMIIRLGKIDYCGIIEIDV